MESLIADFIQFFLLLLPNFYFYKGDCALSFVILLKFSRSFDNSWGSLYIKFIVIMI